MFKKLFLTILLGFFINPVYAQLVEGGETQCFYGSLLEALVNHTFVVDTEPYSLPSDVGDAWSAIMEECEEEYNDPATGDDEYGAFRIYNMFHGGWMTWNFNVGAARNGGNPADGVGGDPCVYTYLVCTYYENPNQVIYD